jgi:hypothetical protein
VSFAEFEPWWTENGGKKAADRLAKGEIDVGSLTALTAHDADQMKLLTEDGRTFTLRSQPSYQSQREAWLAVRPTEPA